MSFLRRRREMNPLLENTILDGKIGKYKIVKGTAGVIKGFRKCHIHNGLCTEGLFENQKVRICVLRRSSTIGSRNWKAYWSKVKKWEEITSKYTDEIDTQHVVKILDKGMTKERKEFLVTDFCETSLENFSHALQRRATPGATESEENIMDVIYPIIHQIGKGYRCLRKMGIIHGNFKGENIAVNSIDSERFILKIDFSELFVEVQNDEDIYVHSRYSSLFCPPPEYKGAYWGFDDTTMFHSETETTSKSEIWYIGCLLFKIMVGEHPYSSLTGKYLSSCLTRFRLSTSSASERVEHKRIENELNELRNKPVEYPDETPHEMKSLLIKMLEKDPEKRMSFNEFFEHPLIIGNDYEGQDLRERIEYIIFSDELEECFMKIVSGDVTFKCLKIILL